MRLLILGAQILMGLFVTAVLFLALPLEGKVICVICAPFCAYIWRQQRRRSW